ncbi:MAG: hypothetical protein IMZ55_09305 [Acidobacteria bacterium]|nr:hypothetical protein [Acidobacteriota bacterium]
MSEKEPRVQAYTVRDGRFVDEKGVEVFTGKHSPAPWRVRVEELTYVDDAQAQRGGENVAVVYGEPELLQPFNAAVIGMAPDLLADCKAALQLIEDLLPHTPVGTNCPGWCFLPAKLRADIAKAETVPTAPR